MTDYSFRFSFRLPKSRNLSITDHSVKLSGQNFSGELYGEPEKAIKDSNAFTVKGSNFASQEDAVEAGIKLRDALTLVFAHCRIGVDFGYDFVHGGFSPFLTNQSRVVQHIKILNDVNGLMIYETNNEPIIREVDTIPGRLETSNEKFFDTFQKVSNANCSLSEREHIAYDLFSKSFFTSNGYAKLLFLVMAVEMLIDFQPRSEEAINLVESFIAAVEDSAALDVTERLPLVGSLEYLRNESIRQSARRLIDGKLNDREYGGIKASKFFQKCYDLRSSVVHGGPSFPSERDADDAAAQLEVLVANLISSRIDFNAK